MLQKNIAIKEYQSPYPESLVFRNGEVVAVGKEFTNDPDWENWIWCEGEGTKAWVPKQFLEIEGKNGVFKRDYNALELTLTIGEELLITEIVNGFGMTEKADRQKGWVPIKHLELIEE